MLSKTILLLFFFLSAAVKLLADSGICADDSSLYCGGPCRNFIAKFDRDYSYGWAVRHPSIAQAYKDLKCEVCVEIGIARGELSLHLLKTIPTIKEYHAVDPFLGGYDQNDAMSTELQQVNSSVAWSQAILHRFKEYGCKFRLHYGLSSDMVSHFSRKPSSTC